MNVRRSVYDRFLGSVGRARVWLVHGRRVRDFLDVDYTMGGNAARYAYVPEGEVWIDAVLGPKDVAATIVHELTELCAMRGGRRYAHAHDIANEAERDARAELRRTPLAKRADAVRWASAFLSDRGVHGVTSGVAGVKR